MPDAPVRDFQAQRVRTAEQVAPVALGLHADHVVAQKPFHQRPAPRQLEEDVRRRERDLE
jgi:hypothetical protein